MEKKKLNESAGALVTILVLGFSYWILKKLGVRFGDNSGLSDRVIDSFDDIYKDRALVNDLAKILQQEGDLDKLFDKIQNHKGIPGSPSWEDSPSWSTIEMMKGYTFQPDAKRIVNKLIKTASYKNFSKRHKFDKSDDIGMEKIFYFIISQKDFRNTAKDFIIKTLDKSNNLIKKGKSPNSLKLSDLLPGYSA
jgi:hypothetical protein